MKTTLLLLAAAGVCSAGCANYAVIEPGHAGLIFNPRAGGLQHDVQRPGRYRLGRDGRVEDFDITFSTTKEEINTNSSEGLQLNLRMAVIYRPIIAELYELDTEIGRNYYDEVIGPEFRSAVRGVFANHSYTELLNKNEKIEDEIETELRRRIKGKHMEISSVTMESVAYAPEIAAAVRAKIAGEQETLRQKSALESEDLRRKMEIRNQAEQEKLKSEAALREKENEKKIAVQQAEIDKTQAETEAATRITHAKAEAEEAMLMAKAHAAEHKAEAAQLTPLSVMMHAYDALGKLGGEGTTIMLGDFSNAPRFLFPQGSVFGGVGLPNKPASTPTKPETHAATPAADKVKL
jgi:regulator of protease activity HflC (stomatin/prohibitin superfamily)